jgi:hypothetical protein
MNQPSSDPTHPAMPGTDPAQSMLVRMARVAFEQTGSAFEWPELDLADPEVRRFGDYELLELIGRGGMGIVYRARQTSLEREVALKFVHGVADDPEAMQRFLAEARIAARLNHPGILPVHEVGSVGELHYIVMPLVTGRTLADRLAQGPLTEDEAIGLGMQLCESLDYAHRLGLLHLDLKPANILLDERGAPLIADFGLARRMDEAGGVDAQEVSGTPSYMAPEQVLIKQYRLTAGTDIYALGAVLFEMLGGVSPHGRGKPDQVTRRALAGRLESLAALRPGISPDLVAMCAKCLELEPSARYASVAAIGEDLRRFRDRLPVSVRTPGLAERARRWLQREPRLAAAALVTLMAVVVGALATYSESLAAQAERSVAIEQRDAAEEARAAEAAQRERAELAVALGARLFAKARDMRDDQDAAAEVVRWLRERVSEDEALQAEVLESFAAALAADGARMHVQSLLYEVLQVMGNEYRAQVLDALASSQHAESRVQAAMLAWRGATEPGAAARFTELLESAIAANPHDPFAWYVATTYCHREIEPACPRPEAARRLVQTDPDNGFAWVLLATAESDDGASYASLSEAARRDYLRDYFGINYVAHARSMEHAGIAMPELLAAPARVLAPGESPAAIVAQIEAWSMPLASLQRFIHLCHPGHGMPDDEAIKSDCVAIATRMAQGQNSLVTNMVGSAVVRRLLPGTPLAEDMRQLRARYLYLVEVFHQLTPEQLLAYPLEWVMRDTVELGELEALAGRVAHSGYSPHPPAEWAPKDPEALLLPEERTRR